MTTFNDGPAAGVVLALRRAPRFLRVVRDRRKKKDPWDALDQLTDAPGPTEELFAYRRVRMDGHMHLCVRGKGRAASGYYAVAGYALVEPQPPDEVMRRTDQWREWCRAQAAEARR